MIISLLALSGLLGGAHAEDPLSGPAVVTTAGPIVVDGRLDEADWARAEPVSDFRRYLPTAGGAPDGVTEVRFLQDERTLYIGVTVRGLSYAPRARVSPREDINDDDQVGIYLDTYGDGRTGYIFYFNPLGIQQDIRYANGSWFVQWDTVYLSEGQVTEDGYTIEIAMPFRSLRYPSPEGSDATQAWRLMITRKLPHEGTKYAWPQLQRGHPRIFLQAGTLEGVQPAARGAGLWVQPVLALRHTSTDAGDGQGLRWTGPEPWSDTVRPGLDLRLGLTPDLGLALTANPDFSQVEADVQIVNLNQRFAFYYPEQRPFFLVGVDAFADQASTLYTRSIVSPLYGAKLSGQEGDLAVGVLHALDARPSASVHERGTPGFSEADLEGALAANSFARLRLDRFDSGYVGLTVADKRIFGSPTAAAGGGANDVVEADISVPFRDVWTAEAYGAASHTTGAGEVLSGGAGRAALVRSPELGLGLSASGYGRSVGFRQEMGFLNQSGIGGGTGGLSYTLGEGRTTWTPGLSGEARAEVDGDQFWQLRHSHTAVLAGIHQPAAALTRSWWRQDGVEVDGWSGSAGWYAQLSRLLTLDLSGSIGQELDFQRLVPAQSVYISGGGSLRPTRGTRLDLDVDQQWFTPEGAEQVQGTRIFSRLSWQFTRPLGLRLNQQTTLRSDSDSAHSASVLLTWLETPGREIYAGAAWSLDENLQVTDQTLFTKISWLFQL